MIKDRQGFTLLELMIVVAIVAIAATMAFPSFESYTQRAKLKSAARELYADFQGARVNTLRDNRAHGLQFNGGGYELVDLGDDNAWAGGDDRVIKTVALSDHGPISFGSGKGAVPTFDTIGVDDGINFTDNKMAFTTWIDDDGATRNFVYLKNDNTDESMAVEILSTTGRVKIWANWDGTWEDK